MQNDSHDWFEPACAETPITPQVACGWSGKSDVQNAFSSTRNNAQLQERANEVDFAFSSATSYSEPLEWILPSAPLAKTQTQINASQIYTEIVTTRQYLCRDTQSITQTKTQNGDGQVDADRH